MSVESIADRYELGDRLGVGGMSTVVLAFDRRLERHVAVKLLAEHLADDAQFVSRFRREALAVARLVHPNIVQVFDFGFDERAGRHFIVMEYVKGQSGAQILRDQTRLSVDDALPLLDGACRALAYAHLHGVVHRDVKPGNILLSDDGQVKLADFGIAKAGDSSAITQVGSVLGTAAYLAPEQAHGEEATPQSDIYGVGVVAYQLISGSLPYEAGSLTELALLQQGRTPARLDEVDRTVTPAFGEAVARALALDPGQRYRDADELREALSAGAAGVAGAAGDWSEDSTQMLAQQDPTEATRVTPAQAPARRLQPRAPSGYEATPPPAVARDERGRGARRALTWLLVLLVLGGAAAAAVVATQDDGERQVRTREITSTTTDGVVDELNALIDDNTR